MSKEEKPGKPQRGRGFLDKIKESGKEFVEGVKEEIDAGTKIQKEKTSDYATKKSIEIKNAVKKRAAATTSPEELYYSTQSWFWLMIFAIFICLTIPVFALMEPKFILVGLMAIIALPFIVIWCLIHMVPTITIFGFTIFDRKSLSLRRQLSLGKEVARLFSREFLQESPLFAFLIFAYIIIFLFILVTALL